MALDITFRKSEVNFLHILRSRVQTHFIEGQIKSTGNQSLVVKSAIIASAFLVFYGLPLVTPLPLPVLVANYMGLGLVLALIGFNIMHDGSHDSYSANKNVNLWMAYSLNLLGGNASFWKQKHCINHHTYTNIEHVDDDIDLAPFLRLHPGQRHQWFHRYQHVYAPVLYCLTLIFWIHYRDYKKYFTRKIAIETDLQAMGAADHFIFWISKAVHLVFFLVVPSFILGPGLALAGYLVASMVCGFTLAMVFQLAHIVEGTHFETPDANKVVDVDSEWSLHQIRTTVNFATCNKALSWFLGGLNFQMVHHLFPRISHVHYPAIHTIITHVCREHNVAFVEFNTLGEAVWSHMRYLRKQGKPTCE